MKKFLALTILGLFAVAATPALAENSQQERMKACNKEAGLAGSVGKGNEGGHEVEGQDGRRPQEVHVRLHEEGGVSRGYDRIAKHELPNTAG